MLPLHTVQVIHSFPSYVPGRTYSLFYYVLLMSHRIGLFVSGEFLPYVAYAPWRYGYIMSVMSLIESQVVSHVTL